MDDYDTKVAKAVKPELAKARKRVKFEKEQEDINAFEHLTLSGSEDDRVLSDFAFESDSECWGGRKRKSSEYLTEISSPPGYPNWDNPFPKKNNFRHKLGTYAPVRIQHKRIFQ